MATEIETLRLELEKVRSERDQLRSKHDSQLREEAVLDVVLEDPDVIDPKFTASVLAKQLQYVGNRPEGVDAALKRLKATNPRMLKSGSGTRWHDLNRQQTQGTQQTAPSVSAAPVVEDAALRKLFGPTSDAETAHKLMKSNSAEYKRLKQLAKEIGILPRG